MKSLIYLKTAGFALLLAFSLISCVKEDKFDTPEIVCNNRFPAANHQLSDLVAIAKPLPTQADIISTDYIVEAYVNSSDETGNIYKILFLQDKPENPTMGVEMDIDGANTYADFPVGALVRINLKGLIVQGSNGNIKIGSYDPNFALGRINYNKIQNYMGRVCDGNKPVKANIVPLEFNSIGDALKNGGHVNQLVKINNVQFEDPELTKTFADADKTGDRYIVDKKGVRLDLRFSNYATFAKTPISPKYEGSGSITLCMSRFNTTDQAYLRNLDDISFSGARFNPGVPDDPSASAVNLFNGADFENWAQFLGSLNSFGLNSLATQGVGAGYNGGNSIHLQGTASGNIYVFTSFAASGLPTNPKRITMRIKGTAVGKSLSFNVYKKTDNTTYYCYNLGTYTKGAILGANDTNSYTGSINTNNQWTLIELDLVGLDDVNLTAGKTMFALKAGSAGVYNLDIDNIRIE